MRSWSGSATNIPACISGAADCDLNFSASAQPHSAATVPIPITIRIAIASPTMPGQCAPSASPTTISTLAGISDAQAGGDHQAGEQHRPGRRGDEQAIEPALLDVPCQVDPGGRAGEARPLQQADRDQEALVAVGGEPRQPRQATEHGGQPEEEDGRREDPGDCRPGYAQQLVRGAPHEGRDRLEVGPPGPLRSAPEPQSPPQRQRAEAEADPGDQRDRSQGLGERLQG